MANKYIKRCSASLTINKCKSKPQWGITSHQSKSLSPKSLQTTNAGENVEKREPSYTVGGNANWYSRYGKQCGDSLNTGNRTAIQTSNPTGGHTVQGNQNHERHMYSNAHCSTAYNSQDTEATSMSFGRRMDEDGVVHIHNGVLLSHKKEHIWVSSNKVDETGAYYTEWSKLERERQILYINTSMWNLERWYWWSYMKGGKGDTDVKSRLLDSVGEGKGGMIWESSIETCPLPNVK